MRDLRQLAIALALGSCVAVGAAGCDPDREHSVRAPKSGVKLRYALEVGTSLDGHLRIGTTRQVEGLSDPLTQSVECDARLFVVSALEDGSRVVRATFRDVDLDWSVPPEQGLSSEAFAKLAVTSLKEIELRFTVSANGKVVQRPAVPERRPPELDGLLGTLGRAAALAFFELPAGPVRTGEGWASEPTTPGTYRSQANLVRLARRGKGGKDHADITVAFTASQDVETARGPRRRQVEGETSLHLSSDGVPMELETELREFDPIYGTAVQLIRGTWKRTDAGEQGTTDVQTIDDPCDPDYVGTATCPNQ